MPLDPQKIRSRREFLKLTQAEAAVLADMPQAHWSRIESGQRNDPQLSTAEKMAKALRCSVAKLVA